jgi:hypothetical protein
MNLIGVDENTRRLLASSDDEPTRPESARRENKYLNVVTDRSKSERTISVDRFGETTKQESKDYGSPGNNLSECFTRNLLKTKIN